MGLIYLNSSAGQSERIEVFWARNSGAVAEWSQHEADKAGANPIEDPGLLDENADENARF